MSSKFDLKTYLCTLKPCSYNICYALWVSHEERCTTFSSLSHKNRTFYIRFQLLTKLYSQVFVKLTKFVKIWNRGLSINTWHAIWDLIISANFYNFSNHTLHRHFSILAVNNLTTTFSLQPLQSTTNLSSKTYLSILSLFPGDLEKRLKRKRCHNLLNSQIQTHAIKFHHWMDSSHKFYQPPIHSQLISVILKIK